MNRVDAASLLEGSKREPLATNTRRARWMACAALALPIFTVCAPFLLPSRQLLGMDFTDAYRPLAALARQTVREEGELPRWNPGQYAGTPVAGNSQSSFYYPGNWLYLVFPVDDAFELLVFAHLLMAAAGMYRLTRSFRLGRDACVIAGLAYALSTGMILRIYSGHMPSLIAQCLAPWVLGSALVLLRNPTPLHAAGFAAATGGLLLGGHPQWIYHLALLGTAAAAWQLGGAIRRKEPWTRPALALAGAALLGAALASAELLPATEVVSHSTRGSTASFDQRYSSDPAYAMWIRDLISLFTPHFPWTRDIYDDWEYRYWHEKSLYVGILPLLLACAAWLRRPPGPVVFFSAAAAAAVAASLSLDLPVHRLLSLLPGFAAFRVPGRLAWIAVLCLSALSAFGWHALRSAGGRLRPLLLSLGGVGAAGCTILALQHYAPPEAGVLAIQAAVALALIAAAPRFRGAAVAAVLLTACDLGLYGRKFLKTCPPGQVSTTPAYASGVGPGRREGRVLDLTDPSARATPEGYRLLAGYGYPQLRLFHDLYASAWDGVRERADTVVSGRTLSRPDALRALNVRWIVARRRLREEWREIARLDPLILFEDPGAKPPAFLEDASGSATLVRRSANRIYVDVRAAQPGALVVSESWMPGWKATLGGAPAPVGRAFEALLRVEVPAGDSTVMLEYDPSLARAGRAVTVLTLMALGGLAGWGVWRRRRAYITPRRMDDKGQA